MTDAAVLNATLTGRYSIERELGAGGMAVVYLANDPRLPASVWSVKPRQEQ